MSLPIVLVIGATGNQGGSAARQLIASKKFAVRALVRDTESVASKALESIGVTLFKGDWNDVPSIEKAAAGIYGLFLISYPSFSDLDLEIKQVRNILYASKSGGVKHVVSSTVLGIDQYETLIKPEPGTFLEAYYKSKRSIEVEVQSGGFENWTLLRGGHFATNYLIPGCSFMYPELISDGVLVSAYLPSTKLHVVDPGDIGSFASAALSDPSKFGGKAINVFSAPLDMAEVAAIMQKVSGKTVEARFRTEEEIRDLQGRNPIVTSQVLHRKSHPWSELSEVNSWGIKLTTFEDFLRKNHETLSKTIGPTI